MRTPITHLMLASGFMLAAATGIKAQSTMNVNTDTDKDGKTTVHIRKVEKVNGVEKVTDTTFTTDGNMVLDGKDILTIDEKGIEDALANLTITDDTGERTVTNGITRITISGDDGVHIDEKKIDDMVERMVVIKNGKDGMTAEVKIDEEEIEKLVSAALAEAGIDTSGKGAHKMLTISTTASDKAKRKADEKSKKAEHKTMVIRMDVKTDAKAGKARGTANSTASPGTENTLVVEDLNFWPNPTDGKFKLRFSLKDKADATLSIYDTFGKQVYSESLPHFRGEYNKNIDISGNEKGVYFVRIEQNGQALVKKIVLQ